MSLVREHINEEYKYFKGKSKEQVEKSLKDLDLEEKYWVGTDNNIPWVVIDCIKEGMNPNFNNNHPLRWATAHEHLDVIKVLLDTEQVDINDNGGFRNGSALAKAFHKAIEKDNNEILKLLLEHPYSRKQLNETDKTRIKEILNDLD